MPEGLRAPFPYFGGKRLAAPLVWTALGSPAVYAEPFCGSAAVFLARPGKTHPREILNDMDPMIANFWRAMRDHPDATLAAAEWPITEQDLHARHLWLMASRERIVQGLQDPGWCDPKAAGWWVWGCCLWIGDGWCTSLSRKLPAIGGEGKGILSPRRAAGAPDPDGFGGSNREWFQVLSSRLQGATVCHGDWQTPLDMTTLLRDHESVGIFLDPPYAEGKMDYAAGGTGTALSSRVREWAVAQGEDPRVRIVLAGYDGEHNPPGWSVVEWVAQGGYAVQGSTGRVENRKRERLWLSPHCHVDAGNALDLF